MASQTSASAAADNGSTLLNFASDGLTLSRLDKIRLQKSGLDIHIEITAPLPVTLEHGQRIDLATGSRVAVDIIDHQNGMALLTVTNGDRAEAKINEIEECSKVLGETLVHVWHGELQDGEALDFITTPDFSPTEVRITTSSSILVDTMHTMASVPVGTTVLVGTSPELPDYLLLTPNRKQFFPVSEEQLEEFSALDTGVAVQDQASEEPGFDETEAHNITRRLFVVRHHFFGIGRNCRRVVLRQGDKLLLLRDSEDGVVWFENTKRDKFVCSVSTVNDCTEPVSTHSPLLRLAKTSEHRCHASTATNDDSPCWGTHTLHNDRVTTQMAKPMNAASVWDDPCTEGGLPLPSTEWRPARRYIAGQKTDYGHFEFASENDETLARQCGLYSANEVMHEAQTGKQNTEGILLKWVPGILEGSQGSFEAAPANVHAFMINFRRRHYFGKGAVPVHELAVYTGSTEFWVEERGADGTGLEQFCVHANYASKLPQTEAQIEQQILRRQGYGAAAKPATGSRASTNNNLTVAQRQTLRNTVLRANSRYASLGFPTSVRHAINPTAALRQQTSFHSDYFDCGYEVKLHNILYFIETSPDSLFLDCVKKQYPRFNADGEAIWKIMEENEGKKPRRRKQKMQKDIPCCPAFLAAGEHPATFSAFGKLGADLEQSVALLDDTEFALGHAAQFSACRKTANDTYHMPPKTPTAAQRQQNSGRGSTPGLIVPNLPRNQQINLNGQIIANWVAYPFIPKDKLLSTRQKAEAEREAGLRAAYRDIVARQHAAGSGAPPPVPRTQGTQSTQAGTRKRKRTDDDDTTEQESETHQLQTVLAPAEPRPAPQAPPQPASAPVFSYVEEEIHVTREDPALPMPVYMEEGLNNATEHIRNGNFEMAAQEILKGMEGDRRDDYM